MAGNTNVPSSAVAQPVTYLLPALVSSITVAKANGLPLASVTRPVTLTVLALSALYCTTK